MNNLSNEKQELKKLLNELPVLICKFLPDTTLTYVNKQYCLFFNKNEKELVGKNFLNFVNKKDISNIKKILKSFSKKQPVKTYFHYVYNHSGEKFYFQWSDKAIFNKHNKIIEFISYGFDITKQKIIEDDNKRQKKELSLSNKKLKKAFESNNKILHDLENKNIAFEAVLNSVENQKKIIKETFADKINMMIIPLLKKVELNCNNCDGKTKKYINVCLNELDRIITHSSTYTTSIKHYQNLSPKQVEICQLIKKGFCTKDISKLLNITIATVEQHRYQIRKKFKLQSNLTTFLRNI